jgi:hypothetical protein
VCRIFDLHFHESTPLLSMELLDGPTLAERLASGGAFSPEGALPILRAIAAALDAAHRRCIVHRDLKPGNVILVADRAVVTDFGLAGETPAGPGDSGAESLIGTPLYMAPEQFRNAAPTPAMDIYSLGALAFEMVAGHPVFPSDTPARLALEKNNPHPAFPGSLDPAWQKAIRRALSPDPAERQPTATAFVDALAIPRDSRRGVLAAGVATVAIGSAWWLMRPRTARPAEAERLLGIATKAMLAGAHWRAVRSLEQAVAMAPWDGELIARLAWAWLMHDQADRTRALLPGAAPGAVRDCVTALLRLDEAGAMEALRDLPDERAILLADLGPPVLPIQRQEANNMSRYPYRAAALARTVREVPEFQAALTHVGRDNDEFVHPLQLDLIRTMLPAPDAPGVDNQLRAAMETARREANPELLCRAGGVQALLFLLAGDDAGGSEWVQRVVDWGQEFQVPHVVAGAVAEVAAGCLRAGRFVDADAYFELAATEADRCHAYRAATVSRQGLAAIREREGSARSRANELSVAREAYLLAGHPRLLR